MLSLDPSSLFTFVITALALALGSLFLVRKAASKYFVVDTSFEPGEGYGSHHRMSIGGGGVGESGGRSGGDGDAVCAACGGHGAKKCSRCKGVRYCSQECQSKHWAAEHKLKCKQSRSSDRVDNLPSKDDSSRRKSSGFGSISLVLPRGTRKVLRKPEKILFPYDEFVKLFNWDKPGFPPCGLLNCGNSCFANVVLQCLTCTRPLAAYLLEKDHSRVCIRRQEDWCFLCELQAHIQRASESRQPFSPTNILSRIPNIGGNLGYGSQEDAHEFMRFAIDTMQSVCLDDYGGEKAVDPSTQETTLVQHIFGGHLQSQVICTKCNVVSNRYENMMDLTVEIHGDAESLEECLDQFTVKEWLDGENKYKCDGCNGYVKACKRLTVHQAPNILTITLKRFQSGRFGKLNKRVSFPEELNLTPYMGDEADGSDLYSLYAVVVHLDMLNASFFGHYICYTKDYYGHWYRIDDCKVTTVDVDEVLSQGAYMLLYSRTTPRKKHLALGEVDSSNVTGDHASLSSNIQSNQSLLRDTGHERQIDSKTDDALVIIDKVDLEVPPEVDSALEGADEQYMSVESEVPLEVNSMAEGVDELDMSNSDLMSLLGSKDSEGGRPSQFSHMQDNAVAINKPVDAGTSSKTLFSAAVQPMECEPDGGIHVQDSKEGRLSRFSHMQDNAVAINKPIDAGTTSETLLTVAAQPMECEPDGGIHVQDNETACITKGISSLSGDPSDVSSSKLVSPYNHVQSMAESSSSTSLTAETEEAFSDEAELKAEKEPAKVAQNPFGSTTNGVCKPKPLFSRGFLDKATAANKSVVKVKRTYSRKAEASASMPIANGYLNGYSELKCDELKTGQTNGNDFAEQVSRSKESCSNGIGNWKVATTITQVNDWSKKNGYNVSEEMVSEELADGGNSNGNRDRQLKQAMPDAFPQNDHATKFGEPNVLVSKLV